MHEAFMNPLLQQGLYRGPAAYLKVKVLQAGTHTLVVCMRVCEQTDTQPVV